MKRWLVLLLLAAAAASLLLFESQRPAGPPASLEPAPPLDSGPGKAVGRVDVAPAAPGRLRLEIRDSAGRSAGSASFGLLRGQDLLESGRTGKDGCVVLAAPGGGGRIFVLATGHAPFLAGLSLEAGVLRLDLPGGAVLAGRVLIDGAVPEEPLWLALRSDPPFLGPHAVPPGAREALGFTSGGRALARVRTAARGRFSFQGLPGGWQGAIRCEDYRFVPEAAAPAMFEKPWVVIDGPADDLVLRLHRAAVLRGRVVEAGSGDPISGARAGFLARWSEALGDAEHWSTGLDERGAFAVPMPRPGLHSLELTVVAPGRPVFSYVPESIPEDLDLGVIRVPGFREVRFVVRDGCGRPVAGAEGTVDRGWRWSRPTGKDGASVVPAPLEACVLRVRARGFLAAKTAVPPDSGDVVALTLHRTNRLAVHLVSAAGEGVRGQLVEIASSGGLFADTDAVVHGHWYLDRGRLVRSSWTSGQEMLAIRPDAEGWAEILGLQSRSPIRIRVLPEAGLPSYEEELPVMPPNGVVEREITAGGPARSFRGSVWSTAGEPLEGVTVFLTAGQHHLSAETDAWGEFSFDALGIERADLRIRGDGFLLLEMRGYSLPPPGEPARFELERGLTLRVEIADELGAAVEAYGFAAAEGFSEIWARHQGNGRLLFDQLPDVPVTVTIVVAGREFHRRHDPRSGDLKIVVPAMGAVALVTKGLPLERGRSLGVLLTSEEDEAEFWPMPDRLKANPAWLGRVFPGSYRATMKVLGSDPGAPGEGGPWRTVAGPVPCTVRAGETTLVAFP